MASSQELGCHSEVGNDIELDAVGRQFQPYLTAGGVCTAGPLWCGLGCCSRTVVVDNAPAYKRLRQYLAGRGRGDPRLSPYLSWLV